MGLAQLTKSVVEPAVVVETAPYEIAGIALVRSLAAVPVIGYCVAPFVPVAVAHVLALAAKREKGPPQTAVDPPDMESI